jgi:hypothetical protein
VKVLVAAGADPNRTTKPAFASEDAIQVLLDAGATVDSRDVNGDTPLGWGQVHVRDGCKSMEAYLLGEPRGA